MTAVDRLRGAWMKAPIHSDSFWVDVDALPLQIDDLEDFLRTLPPSRVYVRAPNRDAGQSSPPRLELGPEPLRDQLMRQSLHVVAVDLHEDDPRFAEALRRFDALIEPVMRDVGMRPIESTLGIFLASGRTITPFHANLEHNFLQQIYGTKHLFVFSNDDYEIFTPERRKRMCVNWTSNRFIPYSDSYQSRATDIYLAPGIASYQPPFAPHWVETDEGISLSLLFSVYTTAEDRLRLANFANAKLRRLSLSPQPIGKSHFRDEMKFQGARLAQSIVRSLRPASAGKSRGR